MRTECFDVIVVGGGPSGLRTASRLAGHGLTALVLEKKHSIGSDVICTGIVGREVFDRFGLDRGSILGDMRTVGLVSPFGTVIEYTHPRTFASIVDREKFDRCLAGPVTDSGGTIMTGMTVEEASVRGDRVVVKASAADRPSSSFEARMLVLATGVAFGLNAGLGLGRPSDFLSGAQIETRIDDASSTRIFFGNRVAPGGFAWTVPAASGRSRIGLVAGSNAVKRCEKFLASEFPAAVGSDDRPVIRSKPIVQAVSGPTSAERVLVVGEAAGQIKTTTGGGIGYGLMCADIAADFIVSAFEKDAFGADDLVRYEVAWRSLLEREISVGYQARKFCSHLSDRQVESLFRLAQTDGIIPIIRETADFERHSGLLLALLERVSFMRVFRGVAGIFLSGGLS